MAAFPELRRYGRKELPRLFMDGFPPEVPEDVRELWLNEVAVRIAKSGAGGIDFLLSCVPVADEARLRAVLIAASLVANKLSSRKRNAICELAQTLLKDERPTVVAEAVDTLAKLLCATVPLIFPLLSHPSPYVKSSALRFFARQDPTSGVPLLKKALTSPEPVVRQNAIDELDDLGYRAALPEIKRLLNDPDIDVRQAARTAVEHFEDASVGQEG